MKKSQSLLLATTSFTADAPAAAVQRVGYAAPAASFVGLLTGVLIIGVLNAGAQQAGWEKHTQEMAIGAIIITAVVVDQLRNRRRSQ